MNCCTSEQEAELFGHNINLILNQRNISVAQCADELGYDRRDLSKIITGQKNITLRTATKIAGYTNVSLFLLFSRNFSNCEYRKYFPFYDEDYSNVFSNNFALTNTAQARVLMDPSTVSKILHGKQKNPTLKTMITIAAATGKTLSDLLCTETDRQTIYRIIEEGLA